MFAFLHMLPRTVFKRLSLTPGFASLHPGLFTFNPFGVRFEQVQTCCQKCENCTSVNFHIFAFSNFQIHSVSSSLCLSVVLVILVVPVIPVVSPSLTRKPIHLLLHLPWQ